MTKKAVVYGAGNIGRGFIGQLFSESGYEVTFIDINAAIINALNVDGRYPIKILSDTETRAVWVDNVHGVFSTNLDEVREAIADADIMATAVGVNVLPLIASPIAEGLKQRWNNCRLEPLNIIICENMIDADKYLARLIKQALGSEYENHFEKRIGLVEASIGRMVPVMTPNMQDGNVLTICVEEYCQLPVDKQGFKGEIPYVKNMIPSEPFAFYIQRKLFIHNMGHALAAYLGRLKNYTYIYEAINDKNVRLAVTAAMTDSALALAKTHGKDVNELLEHVDDLVNRFGNRQLGDTVDRVGKDVKRKLSPQDRLVGAAQLMLQNGINPAIICLGIAAAMKFDEGKSEHDGVNEMLAKSGPEGILKDICRIDEDNDLYRCVLDYYTKLSDVTKLDDIILSASASNKQE